MPGSGQFIGNCLVIILTCCLYAAPHNVLADEQQLPAPAIGVNLDDCAKKL